MSCSTASIVPTRLISTAIQPSSLVAAHEVDGADVRRPLAPDEPEALAAPLRLLGEQLLQVRLDAVLLQRGRLAHVVRHVGEHLGDADVEPVLGVAGMLAHDDVTVRLLDHRRRRHPVGRLVAAVVGVHHHRAVRLDHDQPQRLRQERVEAARVADLAAGDDQAHEAGNVARRRDEPALAPCAPLLYHGCRSRALRGSRASYGLRAASCTVITTADTEAAWRRRIERRRTFVSSRRRTFVASNSGCTARARTGATEPRASGHQRHRQLFRLQEITTPCPPPPRAPRPSSRPRR